LFLQRGKEGLLAEIAEGFKGGGDFGENGMRSAGLGEGRGGRGGKKKRLVLANNGVWGLTGGWGWRAGAELRKKPLDGSIGKKRDWRR